ncbi:hypothetical protein J2T21_000353 [Paeniglutamicibacter psychrophenolicus]|nr:hypothetical protein [Paeniglutamicibacter psychrophenolicus]
MSLSAREEEILQSLEEDLSDQYPVLERRLKHFASLSGSGWMLGIGFLYLLCLLPGLGLMFLGLFSSSTWLGVLACLVLNGGAYLASVRVNPGSLLRLNRAQSAPST